MQDGRLPSSGSRSPVLPTNPNSPWVVSLEQSPPVPPTAFDQLLEATLEHLSALKNAGVRHVEVTPATLALLAGTPSPGPCSAGTSAAIPALPRARLTPAFDPPSTPPLQVPPDPSPGLKPNVSTAEVAPGADKATALEELRRAALVCERCPHLVAHRTQVVFGVGSLDADVMFVGEAPGADEDQQGEPFVGRAGQLLTRILTAMGRGRDSVYIANILKCRPDMPAGARGNRAPNPAEMSTCLPYLIRQIEIIRPRVIVALGGTAVKGLLGESWTIGAARGRWHDFRGTPVLPTFHPAYLLRAEDSPDRGIGEKRKAWEDMLKVMERLGWPITERMRGYFTKSGA